MNRKFWILMLLAFGAFALSGDSCFLSNKNIDVPLRGNVDMEFTSQGFTDTDAETVDFGQELLDIEDDASSDIDTLVSASIENGFWRLIENRVPGTVVTGWINVQRMSTSVTEDLIAPTSVTIDDVGTTFVVAPLVEDGVNLLTAGFDEYVAWRNAGAVPPMPDLRYVFIWNSSSSQNADFDWEARLRFTLVGVFSVEVPDIWD
jgi:hypothetical protein